MRKAPDDQHHELRRASVLPLLDKGPPCYYYDKTNLRTVCIISSRYGTYFTAHWTAPVQEMATF